jgi:hypothetical protein
MKIIWFLTVPFLLVATLFISRVVSPVKRILTGERLVDMRGTWLDYWVGKVFES